MTLNAIYSLRFGRKLKRAILFCGVC